MPILFYYLYRWCLTMWIARMKMSTGGTRGKSWGSFMRECITCVLGPGTSANDAHFATRSFMTHIEVFWCMQEDGPFAPSSRSILAGWRTVRTPSTRRSSRIVSACEMRCGMDRTMYTWVCLMTVELCTYGWTMLVYAYYLFMSMFNLCLLMSNCGIWMQSVRLMESTSVLVYLSPIVFFTKIWQNI